MPDQPFFLDLTVRPPRSARVRLGGYVILPRMLDKGRATLAGKNSEFHYNCPLDQQFLTFAGVDAEALKAELAKGASDTEVLAWIQEHGTNPRLAPEIAAWSAYQEQRGPSEVGAREYFHALHVAVAPKRADVSSWFDILDIDDYASYGGKA